MWFDCKRMFQGNCLTIQCLKNVSHFATVKCFLQLSLGTDIQNGALIYPLECCSPYNPTSTHITAVTWINSLRVINIKNIWRNCISITIEHRVLTFFIWDYIVTNTENSHVFFGFWLILLCDQHRKLACLFYFFNCSHTTYCRFYQRLYYCAINTESWLAFFSVIFALLCYQHRVLTFFIWD